LKEPDSYIPFAAPEIQKDVFGKLEVMQDEFPSLFQMRQFDLLLERAEERKLIEG